MDQQNETDNQQRQAMIRTIALLYSFANIAEDAAARFGPVRRFLVWLLRWAEKAAVSLVCREAQERGCRTLPAAIFEQPRGWGAKEAHRLAQSFRAMACALGRMTGLSPVGQPLGGWKAPDRPRNCPALRLPLGSTHQADFAAPLPVGWLPRFAALTFSTRHDAARFISG